MKRTFLLLSACILFAMQAAAQNLKVTDFKALPNDLTANTPGSEQYDRNGDKCAVIKVITPEKGFLFDTGFMDLAERQEHAGETWLWVSPRLQNLVISHELFGKTTYNIKIPVDGGRTYEMLLDIGTGRFVTLTTNVAHSKLIVDGEYIGQSPLYNKYLNYGKHTIKAENDKYEGTLVKALTESDKPGAVINIEMIDQSQFFGDVTVSVDGQADIYYNEQKMGTGTWRTQLKEGTHTVETRKADCDPRKTTFTVKAQQRNDISVTPPAVHTGRLNLYVRPRNAAAVLNGADPIDLSEVNTPPVGTYQLALSRKGYVNKNVEYTVAHNETTTDTISMDRIKYIKPNAFYFGVGYTFRSMGGITGLLGATYKRHDLQVSYTFGLSSSDEVHWYSTDGNDNYLSSVTYKRSNFAVKYGYLFELTERMGITPQLGYSIEQLSGKVSTGTNLYGDKASANCLSIGAKFMYAPLQRVYLFAAPELSIALSKDDNFKRIADASDISAGGFMATIGVIMNF